MGDATPFNGDMTEALKIDIEQFVRLHQDGLRSYLRLLGCSQELADDLAQESFLTFLRRSPGVVDEAAAAAWLRRTAFNLLRDSKRRAARQQAILRQQAADEIWARYRLDEEPGIYREQLRDCLKRLSQRMRRTIDLFYAEDMSGPEVASAEGRSESDVWSTLHRARKQLRSCMDRKLNHDT